MTLYTPCGPSDRTPQKGMWGGRLANPPLPSMDLGVATFVISLLKLQRPSYRPAGKEGGVGGPRSPLHRGGAWGSGCEGDILEASIQPVSQNAQPHSGYFSFKCHTLSTVPPLPLASHKDSKQGVQMR